MGVIQALIIGAVVAWVAHNLIEVLAGYDKWD